MLPQTVSIEHPLFIPESPSVIQGAAIEVAHVTFKMVESDVAAETQLRRTLSSESPPSALYYIYIILMFVTVWVAMKTREKKMQATLGCIRRTPGWMVHAASKVVII